MAIELEPSWLEVLHDEFEKDYMIKLKQFLKQEKEAGISIYPKGPDIFNAFNKTPFDKVKVVILGQDPYHGEHQAHGLSFSVQKGIAIPRSLNNIYKELSTDIPGFKMPGHGNLEEWAKQGVLLLNATLTVRAGEAASHQKHGWEQFTDEVIKEISDKKRRHRIYTLGKSRDIKKPFDRSEKAPHHKIRAPIAFICRKRFLGVETIFKSK